METATSECCGVLQTEQKEACSVHAQAGFLQALALPSRKEYAAWPVETTLMRSRLKHQPNTRSRSEANRHVYTVFFNGNTTDIYAMETTRRANRRCSAAKQYV